MPPSVCVVGSVNLDLVIRCERLPLPGETLAGGDFSRVPGGKGANQAVAAARLGASTSLVGCVGRDGFADEAVAELRAAGVELAVRTVDEPTGVAVIVVGAQGENQIVVAPGANDRLGPADVDVPAGVDAVICQLEVPDEAVVAAAEADSPLFCLNAAPARPAPRAALERADIVVVNRYELEQLGEETAGRVALTLGADGAVLLDAGVEVARARPPDVDVVDGTAAGDAFCACLVVSLLEGRAEQESLTRACAAGAIAASRAGAQPSLPSAAEVDAILAS